MNYFYIICLYVLFEMNWKREIVLKICFPNWSSNSNKIGVTGTQILYVNLANFVTIYKMYNKDNNV